MDKNKNSKILIIGFGSIGRRHYRNLKSLGYKNISVFDHDDQAFKESNKIARIKRLNHRSAKAYQVAFICSPNNLHIKHALICAKAGCHLFIEKPLSHNLKGIKRLEKICHQKKLINLVACNKRFYPGLQFIKRYLTEKKLGKIYSIHHETAYYLPYWRPRQDYRKNYAAKKATGGGIILDGSHEFDLLFWLNNFSPVREAKFIFNRAGDLEIETEDNCIAIFKFANQALGSVRCDYLQRVYAGNCKIVGAQGNLTWDFNEQIVWRYSQSGKKKVFEAKNYDVNQMYLKEIKYFFQCLDKKLPTFNNIRTAALVLKYCVQRL